MSQLSLFAAWFSFVIIIIPKSLIQMARLITRTTFAPIKHMSFIFKRTNSITSPVADSFFDSITTKRSFAHDPSKCSICYYKHAIVGCNPCKFLEEPDLLKETVESLPMVDYFHFYGMAPGLEINLSELQKLYI